MFPLVVDAMEPLAVDAGTVEEANEADATGAGGPILPLSLLLSLRPLRLDEALELLLEAL